MVSKSRKIALLGCQGIDPVDVFSLAKNHWLESLVLVGDESERLAGSTNRMLDLWGLSDQPRVCSVEIDEAADSAVVILNPFGGPFIGESRIESIRRKADKLESDLQILRSKGFTGILLVITEPINVLTTLALKSSGLDAARVIGIGTDAADEREHHESVWCTGMRGDTAFIDHCDPNCPHFESVVTDAAKISASDFKYRGNRVAGMALCVSRICQAILNDEHEILPVSTWLTGQYEITGAVLTVPCVVGKNGVERIVELPVTSLEKRRLHRRAAEVREMTEKINSSRRRAKTAAL